MPYIVQILPQSDFSVYVNFSDGIIKKYDVSPLLNKGIFQKISDITSLTKEMYGDEYSCLGLKWSV